MDWLSELNAALRYIEDNLDGEIDPGRLAQIARCSDYHFQRLFSYMAGVTLGDYIRRRRMTRAAFDLQNSDAKIIDIALRYGYDSPTAFNRAFRGIHGIAPSAARREGAPLKAYQPISFKITIRGEEEMNYRIETRAAFRIVGYKLETTWTPENQESFAEIPKFWGEHHQKGSIPALVKLMDSEPVGVMGVSVSEGHRSGKFDYYIAVASTQPAGEGMFDYEVPAATWAVFECRGPMPESIQSMMGRIMTEWLPNSGYRYADTPDIELYTDSDPNADDCLSYIWMPVVK